MLVIDLNKLPVRELFGCRARVVHSQFMTFAHQYCSARELLFGLRVAWGDASCKPAGYDCECGNCDRPARAHVGRAKHEVRVPPAGQSLAAASRARWASTSSSLAQPMR